MHLRFVRPIICIVLAATASACCADAGSPATQFSIKVDLAYVSRYVWRGLVLGPDPSLQPSLTVAHPGGLSLNVWASGDLTDANGAHGKLTEVDYTLDYATTADGRSVNGGIIHYTFPNTSFDSTTEAYAAFCFPDKVTTTLSANYDFVAADGLYASVTAGYACAFPWRRSTLPQMNLTARVSYGTAGYNGFYFASEKSAFTDLLISASLPLKLEGRVSLTPSVSCSRVLDTELRDSVADPDNIWITLAGSMSF